MPVHPRMHTFGSRQKLAAELAERIAGDLERDIRDRQQTTLVVSGGSTPSHLFRRLSEHDIPWQQVSVTLADERWVDPAHPDSNENLVRSLLLQNRAAAARFVPLKNSAVHARQGEVECRRLIGRLPRPFGAVVLGMGTDGHTASLFPGAEGLSTALDRHSGRDCLALIPPSTTHERMSLTLPALLDTRLLILLLAGAGKRAALEKALAGGPAETMPVRAILRQQLAPVHIYWSP